jgi:small subunit ribosomal protein S17
VGGVREERRSLPPTIMRRTAVGERKSREGVVVSDAMQKTRVVKIERVFRHPRYQRVVRVSKKLKAHDEENQSKVGDRVLIEETRPLSREKRWRIRAILDRAF